MIRVHVICEGQTEEMFVNEVLASNFHSKQILLVPALIGKPGQKGGNFRFERLLTDVRARLLGDTKAYCTTLFDFYGLPDKFPGKADAAAMTGISKKAACVLAAMSKKLQSALGDDAMRRFIPYLQMYEFEALLFSNPAKLASGINRPELSEAFQNIARQFDSPEAINNSQNTAPSKRITALCPSYTKPIDGTIAATEIGLVEIRQACQQFDAWLTQLEQLPPLAVSQKLME